MLRQDSGTRLLRAAKRKKKKKSEDMLRDLHDNIKGANICIIGAPEGEDRKGQKT